MVGDYARISRERDEATDDHLTTCPPPRRRAELVIMLLPARPQIVVLIDPSEYLRRTMVEHYDWLAALGIMMRERQFRVSRPHGPPLSPLIFSLLLPTSP